jgi:hypothetical protein
LKGLKDNLFSEDTSKYNKKEADYLGSFKSQNAFAEEIAVGKRKKRIIFQKKTFFFGCSEKKISFFELRLSQREVLV